MATEFYSKLNELTFLALDNWKKIGETNLKLGGKLLNAQYELATSLLDLVTMNGEEIVQSKDASEIASLQAEIAQVSGKLFYDSAVSTTDLLTEAGKTYGQLFGSALQCASPANSSKAKKEAPKEVAVKEVAAKEVSVKEVSVKEVSARVAA
jgi:hypothetical protein